MTVCHVPLQADSYTRTVSQVIHPAHDETRCSQDHADYRGEVCEFEL
jgi:hypothetical protein